MELARYEAPQAPEIQALFIETFADAEGQEEGELVGGLVGDLLRDADSRDVQGFVAMEQGRIVAAIVFSRLRFASPAETFLLSPVAVQSAHQGRGIGQCLIRFGLNSLKEKGATHVFTYGDPAFYTRVGFAPVSETMAAAPFRLSRPEGWLGQGLRGEEMARLSGVPRCVTAFDDPAYW